MKLYARLHTEDPEMVELLTHFINPLDSPHLSTTLLCVICLDSLWDRNDNELHTALKTGQEVELSLTLEGIEPVCDEDKI